MIGRLLWCGLLAAGFIAVVVGAVAAFVSISNWITALVWLTPAEIVLALVGLVVWVILSAILYFEIYLDNSEDEL